MQRLISNAVLAVDWS